MADVSTDAAISDQEPAKRYTEDENIFGNVGVAYHDGPKEVMIDYAYDDDETFNKAVRALEPMSEFGMFGLDYENRTLSVETIENFRRLVAINAEYGIPAPPESVISNIEAAYTRMCEQYERADEGNEFEESMAEKNQYIADVEYAPMSGGAFVMPIEYESEYPADTPENQEDALRAFRHMYRINMNRDFDGYTAIRNTLQVDQEDIPSLTTIPANNMPEDWQWVLWGDGSGGLKGPDGQSFYSFDEQTREIMELDGHWTSLENSIQDPEYRARLEQFLAGRLGIEPTRRWIFNESNYDLDYAKECIFEAAQDGVGYAASMRPESAEDIPDNMAIDYLSDGAAQDALSIELDSNIPAALEKLGVADARFVAVGAAGLWNGVFPGGFIAEDLKSAVNRARSGCDETQIWDENGSLFVSGIHHDGRNTVELRAITQEGEDFIEKHYALDDLTDRELHAALFADPAYAVKPQVANLVYGCPEKEFDVPPIPNRQKQEKETESPSLGTAAREAQAASAELGAEPAERGVAARSER